MNIREAILKAATFIRQNPSAYKFSNNVIPECGTPGCMMGWIFSILGHRGQVFSFAPAVLGVTGGEFIHRVSRIQDALGYSDGSYNVGTPEQMARNAEAVLRLYADKYHPAAPVTPPNWSAIASAHPIPDDVRSQEMIRA
jgi:hypothetical protein